MGRRRKNKRSTDHPRMQRAEDIIPMTPLTGDLCFLKKTPDNGGGNHPLLLTKRSIHIASTHSRTNLQST